MSAGGLDAAAVPGSAPDKAGLAAEIRRRIGPADRHLNLPTVSIVVLNRDGESMLRRLLAGLAGHTDYPGLELILIDNGSSDGSVEFIREVATPFPVSIVVNPHNESFSDACNQGAELAAGELLLFLNNDIEPFEAGWLGELVNCLRTRGAGASSSTLVCLEHEHDSTYRFGYGIQHRGLAFREEEDGMIHPTLHGWGADPLDRSLGEDIERGAVAAASLLVDRDAFDAVGGFSRGYVYGGEDIDLCLKLRSAGFTTWCSGRSIAIHHPVSTRRAAPFEEERARKLANRAVLWARWGPLLRRAHDLDRLDGGGIWVGGPAGEGDGLASGQAGAARAAPVPEPPTRDEVEAPGFCLKSADPQTASDLRAVAAALRSSGHRCVLLEGDEADGPIGLNYDVAVYCLGRIRNLPKPGQMNVLWTRGRSPALPDTEQARYDFVSDESDSDRFAELVAAEALHHLATARMSAR